MSDWPGSKAVTDGLLGFALLVHPAKTKDYLLDEAHPVGGAKARFLIGRGFERADPSALTQAITDHAYSAPVVLCDAHPLGHGYRVSAKGPMAMPDGSRPDVTTCWLWRPSPAPAHASFKGFLRFATLIPR